MQWCSESVKNKLNMLAGVAGALIGGLVFLSTPAHATDTGIGVSICGDSAPAAVVSITQPVSDSVVDQPTISLRGTIANSSQIEVSIDGEYNSSASVSQSDATFQIDVTLSAGTHTIGVKANALCGGQAGSDSIVLTYSPVVESPSSGGGTPTELDGTVTLDGTPVQTEAIQDEDIAQVIERLPIIGAAVSVVSDFVVATGLEATITGNNTSVVAGTARVALTVAALSSVVMASSVAPLAAQAIPGLSEAFNVRSHRSMLYLGWIIRGVGLVALGLAYFI